MYAQHHQPYNGGSMQQRYGSHAGGSFASDSSFGQSGQSDPFGMSGQGSQSSQSGQWGGQSGQYGQSDQSGHMGQSGQWSGGGASGWQQQQPQFQGERGQRTHMSFNQHMMNKDYNLVSVLYHALQGVETSQRYCQDAQREGSPEVAQFMEQVQQQQQQIAQRAKELLFRQRQV